MMNIHHVAVDGWSISILVSQLADLYEHFSANTPLPITTQPVVYSQYSAWQRTLMNSQAVEQLEEYWVRQLALPLPVISFPTDRARPAVCSTKGENFGFVLGIELGLGLRRARARARCCYDWGVWCRVRCC